MKRKLKVLVSAYACEPNKGSEPGVGWNWVKQIAKRHEVWVLTRANNREPIESELKKNPMPTAHFVYLDLPYWMRFWKRGQRGIHLYYYLWQILAYFHARTLHRKYRFDISQHITFSAFWFPSFIVFLPIPFIWGPIGGGEFYPHFLRREFQLQAKIYEILRDITKAWAIHVEPFVRMNMQKARLILVCTQDMLSVIPDSYQSKLVVMPQIGMSLDEFPEVEDANKDGDCYSILSAGRLIYWKGVHIVIKAFAHLKQRLPNAKLTIVSDGPEYAQLVRFARQKGVMDDIHFLGVLPRREEVLSQMLSADVFFCASMRDSGCMAVLEALAAGKPVVCFNLGGPGVSVTKKCGIKIDAKNPQQIIKDFSDALYRLAKDPSLRRNMGEAAKQRIREAYDWDRKGEQIERLYELVMRKEK